VFKITLNNNKSFCCNSETTIFDAAKSSGILLEHSCLMARCRSCTVKVVEGTTIDKLENLVLSENEKSNNLVLSCNAIPSSDLVLDVDELVENQIFSSKIVPAKIQSINKINYFVLEVSLRLPPNSKFIYYSGQYVNISKGHIKRSYSIANAYVENGLITFFINKHNNGLMSNYWFNEAKENDLLRIEGPLGSFFLREAKQDNIIFWLQVLVLLLLRQF